MRKRKLKLEADLDPPDTPRTRPGGTAAVRVVEATKAGRKARDPPDTPRTRPGGFAADRAVAATKPGGKKR